MNKNFVISSNVRQILPRLSILLTIIIALLTVSACFGRQSNKTDAVSESAPQSESSTASPEATAPEKEPATSDATEPSTTEEESSVFGSTGAMANDDLAVDDSVVDHSPINTSMVDDSFDRVTLIKNVLNNVVLPRHDQFEAEALVLKETIRAFIARPTTETLVATQDAWRRASDTWAGCQFFSSQEAILIQNQISKWPTNTEFIEKFIAEEDILDAAFVASIGSSSKGLPAIEYLLFDPVDGNETILTTMADGLAGAQRSAYLVGLGDNLYDNAIAARAYWSVEPNSDGTSGPIGKLMVEAESSGNVRPVMQILMNGVSEQLEDLLNLNLRGIVSAELGMPIVVEAPYSNYSLSHITESIQTFQLIYAGGPTEADLGLDDYIKFLELDYTEELMSSHIQTPTPDHKGKPLADVVYLRIDELLAELEKVEEPLAESIVNAPQSVQDAYDAVLRLLILVRVDMVNNFGVTLTFNDGD